MNRSDTINELGAALAKAQASIRGAVKDSTNPHFRSSYADLASVWDACRAALTANSIAVVQGPASQDGQVVTVTTMLVHSSGQWVSSDLTMKPTKPDPQGLGSAITYARRYGLAAMVGVAPEDDDGNAASVGPVQAERTTPKPNGKPPTPDTAKVRYANTVAKWSGVKVEDVRGACADWAARHTKKTLDKLTDKDFEALTRAADDAIAAGEVWQDALDARTPMEVA